MGKNKTEKAIECLSNHKTNDHDMRQAIDVALFALRLLLLSEMRFDRMMQEGGNNG